MSCSACADLQVEAGVLHDSLGQCGDVDPSVTLPRQEELLPSMLWEQPQELLQGQVVVQGHLGGEGPVLQTSPPPTDEPVRTKSRPQPHLRVIGRVVLVVRVGEADAHWRLQVQHVGNLPGDSEPIRGDRTGSPLALYPVSHDLVIPTLFHEYGLYRSVVPSSWIYSEGSTGGAVMC